MHERSNKSIIPQFLAKAKGLEGWEESLLKARKNLKRIIIKSEKKMTIDNYTKFIMTALTVALLLNGLNPWINPTSAVASEKSTIETKKIDSDCFSNNKVATQTLDGVTNVERLLGYIESSVNDIKMTVSGLDRKLSELPTRKRTEKN